MFGKRLSRALAVTTVGTLVMAAVAFASDVVVAVVDVSDPTNAVELAPGGSAAITINMSVTGRQEGTATFEVNRNWSLSGGVFTGSNPQEFTVAPRAAGDPATSFSTTGTVSVAAGHAAGGPFTFSVGAFDITNSNSTGAKLNAGASGTYAVTVAAPPPPSDTTAPDISYVLNPADPDGSNGWYISDVTVTWSVVDNESTISSSTGCGPTTISADTAGTTLTCSATSAGGTASESVTIKRDATAPVVNPASVNNTTWRNTPLSQVFTASDAPSGLADASDASFTLTASAESVDASTSTTVSKTVFDNAGNSTSRSVSALIDMTDPTVALVGGPADEASYVFGSVPAAPTCSASDALSGLAGACSVAGYSAAVGTHTVTASAIDNAGNNASASATYTVLAWTLTGFYSPVDMNGVVNTVKGGSTVPLKFEVFAGPTELTSTSGVQSFVQTKIACDTSASLDEIEIVTTGGTSLRYDATGGQFIQNWQTPKQAGACYRVTMTTQDGSTLVALFKLK
jgi:hypothetical protein